MKVKKLLAILFFFALAIVSTAEACDFCTLSQGISPLQTFTGTGIRVNERYTLLNSAYKGRDRVNNFGAKEEYWTTEITGFHNITEDIILLTVIPLKKTKTNGHFHAHGDGSLGFHPEDKGGASGLGDIIVMGRYTFLRTHTMDTTTMIAGIAGIRFPTGKTDSRADNGEFLDSHLQLGTGSTDYILGFSVNHVVDRFSIATNLLDIIPTEGQFGDTRHKFGNILNYDVTTRYRLFPDVSGPSTTQLYFSLGVNGELRQKEKEKGVEVRDSGGHTVYITPGVQLMAASHWMFEFTYQHAVYHNIYGAQLAEDYRANGAVTYLF